MTPLSTSTKEIIALLERTKSNRVKHNIVRGLASIDSPEATAALEKLAQQASDGELPEWPETFDDFATVESKTHHTKIAALTSGYARVALERRKGSD